MIPKAVAVVLSPAVLALLLAAPAFAAPRAQEPDAAKQETAKEEKVKEEKAAKARDRALKRAALERELPIAKEKLAKARQDAADQVKDAEAARGKVLREHALAKARLETFESREMPNRTAKAQLDVQNVKDGLDNAKEELEQLELMYKEQDLADKTREIVIRRAKRDLDRAVQRLTIQQAEMAVLVERTLPQEREKLALEVEVSPKACERRRGSESPVGRVLHWRHGAPGSRTMGFHRHKEDTAWAKCKVKGTTNPHGATTPARAVSWKRIAAPHLNRRVASTKARCARRRAKAGPTGRTPATRSPFSAMR